MPKLKIVPVLLLLVVAVILGGSVLFGSDTIALASDSVAGSYQNALVGLTPDLSFDPNAEADPLTNVALRIPLGAQPAAPQNTSDFVPANSRFSTYVVKRGDALSKIAWRYRTTVWSLMQANRIRNINRIFIGQRLVIPGTGYWNWWQWKPAVPPGEPASSDANGAVSGPPVHPAVCNPLVNITSPEVNQTVDPSSVVIMGTANLPAEFDPGSSGFSYYKVEVGQGEKPIVFHVVGSLHYNTVSANVLETWNTSVLPNDTYTLRLYSVSSRGNFPPPCEVRVFINRP
jgi:LysM repeat protein